MLAALLVAAALSLFVAWVLPVWDGRIAWALGAMLALLAGTRSGGFDLDEYEFIIEAVRTLGQDDWLTALFFAKDPLFLLIIRGVGLLSEDTRWIYLLVATVSVATKVQASAALLGHRTTFIALYAVLLAPGLEFAAIRSGMAVGLLMLALVSVSRWRSGWAVAAVLSHSSMVVAWIGRLLSTHRWTVLSLLALALPLAVPLLAVVGQDDPRYTTYFENPGTLTALLLPSLTLAANLGLRAARRVAPVPSPLAGDAAMSASLLCAVLALIFALPFVTVAYRIMEIAWVLMLAQWLALAATRSLGLVPRLAGGGTLLAVLALTNVLRDTWTVLVDLPL